MLNENFPISVKGHVKVSDDLGNIYVNKSNAVHPQNMARVIARALANESNFSIYRVAFGNGGTTIDATQTITFNPPNDGQTHDTATWASRLYNETYSEIIDDSSALLGTDPGSSDTNGTRPGGGAVPSSDPTTTTHVSGPGVFSNELGLTSQVVITAVLNPQEPTGQLLSDGTVATDSEGSFVFDEIGLYTSGAPAAASSGSQDVNVGNKTASSDTALLGSTQYSFSIEVDGGTAQVITFTTPANGSGTDTGSYLAITYGDLCEALNTGSVAWGMSGTSPLPAGTIVSITDDTDGDYPSITNQQTFGYLRFTSGSAGSGSSIALTDVDLFSSLNSVGGILMTPVDGQDAGVQNAVTTPSTERERLLTHLIFSPVLKSANRTLSITYTLTISVARTQH